MEQQFTDDEITAEIKRIESTPLSSLEALGNLVERVFIRSLRIACGIVLAGFGLWAGNTAWDALGKPFAEQSLLGLVGGLALAYLAFVLFRWAWLAGFGEGPTRDELRAKLRTRAVGNLARRTTPPPVRP